jgi:drug/metabolite transporter (DMT)-like permease
MAPTSRPDGLTLAAYAVMIVLAGLNAVGIEVVVEELDPFWAATLRFSTAGLIFAVAMVVLRVPIPRGGALVGALLYGVIGFGLVFACAFWGLQEAPSGTAQVLIALVPLLTLFLAVVHGLERFRLRALVGALVALGGVAYVFADQISANIPAISLLVILVGSLGLAESGVLVKLTPRAHPVATNAVGMLTGALVLAALSVLSGESWVLPHEPRTWVALTYLILGGSVVVFWLFVFVLGRWTASAVSYEFLLIPLVTVPVAAVVTGEPITPAFLIGGVAILFGVYLGAFAPERQPKVAPGRA